MINLIYTLEEPENPEAASIFLAGPTGRGGTKGYWRERAISQIKEWEAEIGTDLNIFVPEHRGEASPEWTYSRQVSWEEKNLKRASVIMFWIPRTENLPGFTTNIEFGEYLHSGKIVVGAPLDALKMDYIHERCAREGIKFSHSLGENVKNALTLAGLIPKIFFTSDTHFGQERTLKLSRRPFGSVEEMDTTMIDNWNEMVGPNDIVYHLGDFGELPPGRQLNGQIRLVQGNYDEQGNLPPNLVEVDPWYEVEIGGVQFNLTHKPSECNPDMFNLFGHIHKLQMVRRNGLNVGMDCHNFRPLTEEDILFYYGAIKNHYDEEVFCE